MWFNFSSIKSALFLSILCSIGFEFTNASPPVSDDLLILRKITSGIVRGRKVVTPRTNVTGYSYFSIPIAEPPIGELRFRRPVSRQPWNGTLDATQYKYSCYWNSTITSTFVKNYNMSEDCIRANVFTNAHCLSYGGCAVAVYIHGGFFGFGTPLQFNSDVLTENFSNSSRNVVLVTLGFRAAAFAMLNLNHKLDLSIDLNAAGHDIIHGLHWIQEEIHVFGGDPRRVTLMGHSGGASTVNLIAASPIGGAGTLFHQLVVMSKIAEEQDVLPDNFQRVSRTIAKHVGCAEFNIDSPDWDNVEIVENVIRCLRDKPAIELSAAQPIYEPMDLIYLGMVRDRGEHAILPEPYDILAALRTPVPTIVGTVSKEWLQSRDALIDVFTVDKSRMWRYCNILLKLTNYAASESAIEACLAEYNTASRAIYAYDDVAGYLPSIELANNLVLLGAPVYLYEFAYEGIGDAFKTGDGLAQPLKETYPGHSHELIYLVGQHLGNFTAKDYEIQHLYSQIFIDFINTGSPHTEQRNWIPYNSNDKNYFLIDYPDPTLANPGMRDGYHKKAYAFWDVQLPLIAGDRHEKSSAVEIIYPGLYFDNHPFDNRCSVDTVHAMKNDSTLAIFQFLFFIAIGIIIFLIILLCIVICVVRKRNLEYDVL